jgi:hypothetical protein
MFRGTIRLKLTLGNPAILYALVWTLEKCSELKSIQIADKIEDIDGLAHASLAKLHSHV